MYGFILEPHPHPIPGESCYSVIILCGLVAGMAWRKCLNSHPKKEGRLWHREAWHVIYPGGENFVCTALSLSLYLLPEGSIPPPLVNLFKLKLALFSSLKSPSPSPFFFLLVTPQIQFLCKFLWAWWCQQPALPALPSPFLGLACLVCMYLPAAWRVTCAPSSPAPALLMLYLACFVCVWLCVSC